MNTMDTLGALRMKINNIDNQILELIAKRLDTAKQIGLEKRRLGLQIIDEEVSAEVVNRNLQKCIQLDLETQLGEELTKLLMRYSVKVQGLK